MKRKKLLDKDLKLKDILSSKTDLLEECAELLKKFAEKIIEKQFMIKKVRHVYEPIILGQITAFLSSVDPNLKILVGPTISSIEYRPDLIIEKDGNKIVVEIKASLINTLIGEKNIV